MANLPVVAGQLPAGFCAVDYQTLANGLASIFSVPFSLLVGTGIQVSSTTPPSQSLPWLKLDTNGRPIGIYTFVNGQWTSPNPTKSGIITLWDGDITQINLFDGGDGTSNVPTATSGPMWQLYANLAGRFPVGRSDLANPSVPFPQSGNLVTQGLTGGEEQHSLLLAEMPPHAHPLTQHFGGATATGVNNGGVLVAHANPGPAATPLLSGETVDSLGGTGSPPVVTGHNTLPPFFGLSFIQRTARTHYVG